MSEGHRRIEVELDDATYGRFVAVARECGLSREDAAREALITWIRRQRRPDPDDPAFTVLDELEESDGPKSADPTCSDDLVETWCGDDVEFELADDPTARQQ